VDSRFWAPMLALSFASRTDNIIGSTPARCRLPMTARMADKAKPPGYATHWRLCCFERGSELACGCENAGPAFADRPAPQALTDPRSLQPVKVSRFVFLN
jgi:hypothetical protein